MEGEEGGHCRSPRYTRRTSRSPRTSVGAALGDQLALMQDGDLLGDGEHHIHVVLGEEQGELALGDNALQQPDGLAGLGGRHAGRRLIQQEEPRVAGQRDAELQLLLVSVRE